MDSASGPRVVVRHGYDLGAVRKQYLAALDLGTLQQHIIIANEFSYGTEDPRNSLIQIIGNNMVTAI